MGKTSPYMSSCRRGKITCCRKDTHRRPFIQRMEKPHPVWETQEVGKSSREAVGWVCFGRTDRVCAGSWEWWKIRLEQKRWLWCLKTADWRVRESDQRENYPAHTQDASRRTEHGSFRQWALDCLGSNFCSSIFSAKIKTNNITHPPCISFLIWEVSIIQGQDQGEVSKVLASNTKFYEYLQNSVIKN